MVSSNESGQVEKVSGPMAICARALLLLSNGSLRIIAEGMQEILRVWVHPGGMGIRFVILAERAANMEEVVMSAVA